MNQDDAVREQLVQLLRGGHAHMSLDDAVADFPLEHMNTCPPHVSYTPWHLLEHMRRAQRDILDFIRDPQYAPLRWPDDFWPPREQLADAPAWQFTLSKLRSDRQVLEDLVVNSATDLYTPLPQGTGQNILREILTVSDHLAYHTGEFAILRQVMQTWPPTHDA